MICPADDDAQPGQKQFASMLEYGMQFMHTTQHSTAQHSRGQHSTAPFQKHVLRHSQYCEHMLASHDHNAFRIAPALRLHLFPKYCQQRVWCESDPMYKLCRRHVLRPIIVAFTSGCHDSTIICLERCNRSDTACSSTNSHVM